MSRVLDIAAAQSRVAAFVFPLFRFPEEIAELMQILASSDDGRWQCEEREWKEHPRDDAFLAWLRWRTAVPQKDSTEYERTSVMGLAPLGTMPVHRRAPFVSLVVWPGGRENEFREKRTPTVGFLDIKLLGMDRGKYDAIWETTKADVVGMKLVPPEGAAQPWVTFCLPRSVHGIAFPPAATAP